MFDKLKQVFDHFTIQRAQKDCGLIHQCTKQDECTSSHLIQKATDIFKKQTIHLDEDDALVATTTVKKGERIMWLSNLSLLTCTCPYYCNTGHRCKHQIAHFMAMISANQGDPTLVQLCNNQLYYNKEPYEPKQETNHSGNERPEHYVVLQAESTCAMPVNGIKKI